MSKIMLIGDFNQIPFTNRSNKFDQVKYHNANNIVPVSETLNLSYRFTKTTALLSNYYKDGMKTCSYIQNEFNLKSFNTLQSIRIDKEKFKVLISKQSEKRDLWALGYDESIIHKYHRRQNMHIAVT